jgi:hypothetical protein
MPKGTLEFSEDSAGKVADRAEAGGSGGCRAAARRATSARPEFRGPDRRHHRWRGCLVRADGPLRPDAATDSDGAARWVLAVRARLPRYGYTPSGRPIHATTDPDCGRACCACGSAWADQHSSDEGTTCPKHLRPGWSADAPADQLYRVQYADQLPRWRGGRMHLAS